MWEVNSGVFTMPTGVRVAKITVSFNQIQIKNALQHIISLLH